MLNYDLKKKLLNNGSVTAYRELKRIDWAYIKNGEIIDLPLHYQALLDQLDSVEIKECDRIYHAHLERVLRLKKRLNSILSLPHSKFITLTFTDEVMAKTSPQTRRKYVTRYLQQFNGDYVANIDFGSINGREHYHAVVGYTSLTDIPGWKYGYSNIQTIRLYDKTDTKLAKYMSKLTNHAIKATTKGSKMIYAKQNQ